MSLFSTQKLNRDLSTYVCNIRSKYSTPGYLNLLISWSFQGSLGKQNLQQSLCVKALYDPKKGEMQERRGKSIAGSVTVPLKRVS